MTKFDIKNYFEKIYGLKIAKVNTRIQLGTFARHSLLIDPPNSLKSFCHLSALSAQSLLTWLLTWPAFTPEVLFCIFIVGHALR